MTKTELSEFKENIASMTLAQLAFQANYENNSEMHWKAKQAQAHRRANDAKRKRKFIDAEIQKRIKEK